MSQTPGKMGRLDIKSEEKAPSDANKRGKGFGGGNNVRRKAFSSLFTSNLPIFPGVRLIV